MTIDPRDEPGLDPSVKSKGEAAQRKSAGKGLVFFIGAFVAVGFFLYVLIIIYGAVTAT